VYFIDWYDQQHCHNPNTERWDRGNGRVYRMQWQATYKPAKVDLMAKSDVELVELLTHKNQWYGRTARRLLHERAQQTSGIASNALVALRAMAARSNTATHRLSAFWTLHAVGGLNESYANAALTDIDPFVRAWAVQLITENGTPAPRLMQKLIAFAQSDTSPVVRRYLASAVQRLPGDGAWAVIEALAQHGEDGDDRNLPFLLWHGLATQWALNPAKHTERAFAIAAQTKLPQLTEWIYWRAATLEGDALNRTVSSLSGLSDTALHRRLAGLWLALEPRANVPMPTAWNGVSPVLYKSSRPEVQRLAERIAAAFGDSTAFPRLRDTLADTRAEKAARQHAFNVLSRAQDKTSLPVFVKLLDDSAFRTPAINVISRFDSSEVSAGLLRRFTNFAAADRTAALDALTSRPAFALALLDAVANGQVPRDQLTAFHVTRLINLKNADVDKRVAATWGRIQQTPAEKNTQIAKLEKTFNEAPLWAYNAGAGKQHFQKLCAQCHRIGNDGARLGPELTGAGKHGIRYYLENIIDPDAVIGTDFQGTTIETKDGESISGLLVNETASAVTLRTTAGESVIPKSDIKQKALGQKSLMPEGLLDSITEREQIELLKFLTTN
jgi:putative heme-binding domain-containing protein